MNRVEIKDDIAQVYLYDVIEGDGGFWGDLPIVSESIKTIPEDIKEIKVHISSYGGDVKEGYAIYNNLKNHPAHVTTMVDGFACSIASVIFCAGDERVMNDLSMLMIHNAWSMGVGNADELENLAGSLRKISNNSREAYLNVCNLDEAAVQDMMDKETWLDPQECLDQGFATKIEKHNQSENPSQSGQARILELVKLGLRAEEKDDNPMEEVNSKLDQILGLLTVEEAEEEPEEVDEKDPNEEIKERFLSVFKGLSN